MLEGKPLGVAVATEEVEYPLLLLRVQLPLAAVVAVVRAVASQISLDFVAQRGIVFLLHVTEQRLETPRQRHHSSLAEKLTLPTLPGSRINRRSPMQLAGNMQACLKAQTLPVPGTILAEGTSAKLIKISCLFSSIAAKLRNNFQLSNNIR